MPVREYAFDNAFSVFLPVTIAVAVVLVALIVFAQVKNLSFKKEVVKYGVIAFLYYVSIVALVLLALYMDMIEDYHYIQAGHPFDEMLNFFLYLPIYSTIALAMVAGGVTLALDLIFRNKKVTKIALIVSIVLVALAIVACIVLPIAYTAVTAA